MFKYWHLHCRLLACLLQFGEEALKQGGGGPGGPGGPGGFQFRVSGMAHGSHTVGKCNLTTGYSALSWMLGGHLRNM
jgi:hypothetical protein